MVVVQYNPFIGFTLFGVHSSKFNVYRILNGDRYNFDFSPNFKNVTETVSGYEGEYDFGINIRSRRIVLRCYCEGITESQYRQLQGWLSPKKKGQLILDEAPYKAYTVRLARPIEFSFMPLHDSSDEIVYYGTFDIELVATSPYAYSVFNSLDEVEYDNNMFYNSGILYSDYLPPTVFTNITGNRNLILYNGGTENSNVNVRINGTWGSLQIVNLTTNQGFTLSKLDIAGTFEVDANYGQCRLNGLLASGYHSGTYIQLAGTDRVDHYINVRFTNSSNVVTFPEGTVLDDDIVGKYIFLQGSQHKIDDKPNDRQVVLSSVFTGTTGLYNIVIVKANEITITGQNLNISNLEFVYRYTYI